VTSEELGERIRRARELAHLSQDELAQKIAKDQRAISLYESGRRRIYAIELPKIAQALNVPVSYFFERDELSVSAKLLEEFSQLPNTEVQALAIELLRIFRTAAVSHSQDR
jgi:transcriptional regulator with XRE-family HTH domain